MVREPEDDEVLSDVMITPSAHVQLDQVGVRLVDQETNTSVVDIRPLKEEVRTDIIHACSKGIQVPSSSSEFSSQDTNTEESMVRPRLPIPQLNGPIQCMLEENNLH